MRMEKLFLWGAVSLSLLAVGVSLWAFLKFAMPVILPFAIAYGMAYGVRRLSRFLNSKIKLSEKIWSGIVTLSAFGAAGASLWFGFSALVRKTRELIPHLADVIGGSFAENVSRAIYDIGSHFGGGEQFAEKVYDTLGSLASAVAEGAIGARSLGALPSVAFAFVLWLVSFFAFVFGDFRVSRKILSLFPKSKRDAVSAYLSGAVVGAGKYIKAQILVIGATATLLFAGFLVIKCANPLLLALGIAVLDALPILGVGTALVPWAAYCFITKSFFRGWALLVILLVSVIGREALESRFIGKGAGVHPVLILASAYAGYKISGVWGMILLPMCVNIGSAARNQVNKKQSRS